MTDAKNSSVTNKSWRPPSLCITVCLAALSAAEGRPWKSGFPPHCGHESIGFEQQNTLLHQCVKHSAFLSSTLFSGPAAIVLKKSAPICAFLDFLSCYVTIGNYTNITKCYLWGGRCLTWGISSQFGLKMSRASSRTGSSGYNLGSWLNQVAAGVRSLKIKVTSLMLKEECVFCFRCQTKYLRLMVESKALLRT